jgi:tetratricopeptide (TPR) repeat protein
MGVLCVDEGRFDEALGLLAEGMQMAERTHDVQGMVYARAGLGELDLLLGRARPILERFESADSTMTWESAPAAEAYLLTGNERQAESVIEEMVRVENLWKSAGLRVRGMLHTRREEWEQAEAEFLQAREHARSIHYPLEEGRAVEEHGMMLAARGDQEEAAVKIREALAIFREIGAEGYARRAERLLREIES